MKLIFITLILLLSFKTLAGWTPISTGINDVFTGVVFSSTSNGAIVGHNGLYYTNTGGLSPSDWTRFNIINNSSDSVIYNNTKFTHCTSNHMQANYNILFACGQDTVNNKAVILAFNILSHGYQIIYYGVTNSKLNYIQKRNQFTSNDYYSVGDNGLLIHFNSINPTIVTILNTGTNQNLNCVAGNGDSKLWIGYDGGLIRGTGDNTNITFNNFPFPNKNFKDLLPEAADAFFTVGNGYFEKYNLTLVNVNEYTNYENGPLNASSIFDPYGGTVKFVGTDHGIYRSIGTGYLEIQPSTSIYKIKEFWQIPLGTNTFFACGENGTLLTTIDYGGPTKPNLQVNIQGACVNSSPNVQVLTNSSTSCSWYLDGLFVSSSCSPFNQNFNSPGLHELKLIGTNGTYGDTIIKYFNIVNPPQINLGTIITDSLLCKSESVQIEILNPELNTTYTLRKFGSTNSYGSSSTSTGANIIYNSTLVSDSGIYYLRANSSLASNCYKNFTDTIHIDVEKTEARFHANRINAYLNDSITFYNNSKDANLFQWTFSSGANLMNSNDENVLNSFNQLGSTSTQLIVSSLNGCSDTLSKTTTFICNPNNTELDPWYNRTQTFTEPYNGGSNNKKLNNLIELSDGHVTVNYIKGSVLPTQNGVTSQCDGLEKYLICKYDKLGTLLWQVTFVDLDQEIHFSILDVNTDKKGNLYLSANLIWSDPYIIDNNGDSISLYYGHSINDYQYGLIKIDKNGKFLWSKLSDNIIFGSIGTDKDLNVIVNASCMATAIIATNGVTETVNFDIENTLRFLKFDSSGVLSFHFRVKNFDPSFPFETRSIIKCDSLNNIYIAGGLHPNMTFYSSDGTIGQDFNGVSPLNTQNFYIAKYNQNGLYQWVSYSNSVNPNEGSNVFDMAVSKDGQVYISGMNSTPSNLHSTAFMIYGSDGNISAQTNYGSFFIAKINTNGFCNWLNVINSGGIGNKINLYNDEVSVIGSNMDNTQMFLISNTPIESISIDVSDYFIAVYDTVGNLKHYIKNGNNLQYSTLYSELDYISLFRDEIGMYYVGANRKIISTYTDFGFTNGIDDYFEGNVVKFDKFNSILITPNYHTTNQVQLCDDTISFPDGSIFVSPSIPPVYETFYTSSTGVDSAVTTIVNLSSPQTYSNSYFICRKTDYTFLDNVTYENILNTFTRTYYLDNGYGCNNQYNTTINVVNNELIATQNINVIQSNATGGQLQWTDCSNNYSPIPGETNSSFIPTSNGVYALTRFALGCYDTSNCITFSNLSIAENNSTSLEIYPNPSSNTFYFNSDKIITEYKITDFNGKIMINETNLYNKNGNLNLENHVNGIYFIEFIFETGESYFEKIFKISN